MSKVQTIITNFDPAGPFAGLLLPPRFRKRQSETRFKQRWQVTLEQYLALMHEGYNLHLKKWLPLQRYQRGSIMIGAAGAMAAAGAGGIGGFVVLTAHSINDFAVSGTATAQIDFENDGELWGRRAILSDLQYTGEWWSDEPEASIGDSYAARHRSSGKIGTYSFEAAAAENWITITGTRSWGVSKSAPTGFKSCDATFECGPQPSGPADDTAFIELEADFDDS